MGNSGPNNSLSQSDSQRHMLSQSKMRHLRFHQGITLFNVGEHGRRDKLGRTVLVSTDDNARGGILHDLGETVEMALIHDTRKRL